MYIHIDIDINIVYIYIFIYIYTYVHHRAPTNNIFCLVDSGDVQGISPIKPSVTLSPQSLLASVLCKTELTNLTLVTMVTCTPTLAAASYRALADLGAGRCHHFSASDSIVRSR